METVRKTRKLPERVADKLREMIIQESLKTGAKLPAEAELMERFGVSRSTVREAVKILQTEHIVDIRQGQGTFLCAMPGLASDWIRWTTLISTARITRRMILNFTP